MIKTLEIEALILHGLMYPLRKEILKAGDQFIQNNPKHFVVFTPYQNNMFSVLKDAL